VYQSFKFFKDLKFPTSTNDGQTSLMPLTWIQYGGSSHLIFEKRWYWPRFQL